MTGNPAPALRQMLAVLDSEREALAALDLDAIVLATTDKDALCSAFSPSTDAPEPLDDEARALLLAAKQKNETNRRIRNLLAANVAARLEALSGKPGLYRRPAGHPAGRGAGRGADLRTA